MYWKSAYVEDWIVWLNAYWYQDFPLQKGMKLSDYMIMNNHRINNKSQKREK